MRLGILPASRELDARGREWSRADGASDHPRPRGAHAHAPSAGALRAALAPIAARHGWQLDDSDSAAGADVVVWFGAVEEPDPEVPGTIVRVDGSPRHAHGLDTLPLRVDGVIRSLISPPAAIEAYGEHADQRLEWHLPAGAPRAVAVLVHGGFYRSRWEASLMTGLAADLAARGWASANLEYRRPDEAGWEATTSDVRAGVLTAARTAHAPDAGRPVPLVLIGHSAGGQLVLQAAETLDVVDLAVSLAGVVDLDAAHDRFLGEDAVRLALGDRLDVPGRYAAASPARWTSRRAGWLLVQGADDSADLVEMNRRLAAREDLGRPELLELPGDHFSVIDPDASTWQLARARLTVLAGLGAEHPLDVEDPAPERDAFIAPVHAGAPVAYLAANALGLQSSEARDAVVEQLDVWRELAHGGHYAGERAWLSLTDRMREPVGRLVGARPAETLAANGLSVNLHLLMASFFRPDGRRTRILMEDQAFPSDRFAVRSHLDWHGLGEDALLVAPRRGEHALRTDDVLAALDEHGDEIALVLLGGVNFLTGELLDIPAITAAAHRAGAVVGWDLAHAVGNVELALHEWGVDWAAWCSYKYLNGGPGAVAGLYVHERHHGDAGLPRLAGWFGQRTEHRFGDHAELMPSPDAEAWQISNPSILALAPVLASVRMFDRHTMPDLAARGRRLSARLIAAVDPLIERGAVELLTPRDPARRGAQVSLRVPGRSSAEIVRRLEHEFGVVADARTPDVVRLAPSALQTSYAECDAAAAALAAVLAE
ncbi:kynureninase [Agromyces aerolatus]|uniref:kynureninase n=1 Tax=Agromyces sp. LY-1074 TaxID=3074080 RepID=UPI00285C0505|nr:MULTISPECIES: kynureninase [unclassified Agromyces]MDR5698331.1 kynureninase [Agromyces sp. LY-1074]MDR5704625.1 kynureninase [Agromyces sp. LY-1358]